MPPTKLAMMQVNTYAGDISARPRAIFPLHRIINQVFPAPAAARVRSIMPLDKPQVVAIVVQVIAFVLQRAPDIISARQVHHHTVRVARVVYPPLRLAIAVHVPHRGPLDGFGQGGAA